MHLNTLPSPHETPILPPGCLKCAFRDDCRGLGEPSLLFSCIDFLCCKTGDCDEVCPNHPKYFERLAEVGNIRFDDLKPIAQQYVIPPIYVPHIPHEYTRQTFLKSAWASVSTCQLLRKGGLAVTDERSLREKFNLSPETQVVLRGVDEDACLERYWANRKKDGLAQLLQGLSPALIIAPNFSHFGDVPRMDNLFNRRRQVLCIEEMAEAGLNVAPHLNDIVPGDWVFWHDYLRDNPTIGIVAKEFQTRCRRREEGTLAIMRLVELQERLGRSLHPIIIGGAQFIELLAPRFHRFTILDSRPLIGAVNWHRFSFDGKLGRLLPDGRLPGFGVDDIANENIRGYVRWLSRRARSSLASSKMVARKAG